MKTLSNIKKDLEFNSGLSSLIEALKTIAVAQFRTLEQKLTTFKELLLTIESFFEHIDISQVHHQFLNPKNQSQLVVAITSDTGLLGGLNMQVITRALSELGALPGKLVVVGERGKVYARETGVTFVYFSGINDEQRQAQAKQLRDYLLEKILEGSFGGLKVIYPHPVSFTVQRVETVSLLPYQPRLVNNVNAGNMSGVILESRPEDLIEYLVYAWIGQKLYEIFGLSRLAEFAARFVHLEGSCQRIKEMDAKIRLEYFRVRHELIDRNMRELFAARLTFN